MADSTSRRDQLARKKYDAIVVGSGPNGLAAAIAIAQMVRSVLVIEAEPTLGGGCRSAELTMPGYVHDICSAIHPLTFASPFLSTLPLDKYGLEWCHPPAAVAHPLDDGRVGLVYKDMASTTRRLERDGPAYEAMMRPFADAAKDLYEGILGPFQLIPKSPFLLARFGMLGLRSCEAVVRRFRDTVAPAMFAGIAAHSILPLESVTSAAAGLLLGSAGHAVGWPFPRGGAQRIIDAMVGYLRSLGGEVVTGWRVDSFDELPPARAVLFDVVPKNLVKICGDRLGERYRRRLRSFQHGPGSFKLDWALDGPIPWKSIECSLAATVHLGGTYEEVAASERMVGMGEVPARPYVLLAQHSAFDPTRAPAGKHTGWAYCHVPNGSTADMTEAIERQVERFAPGFRDRILARSVMSPAAFETHNANYVGGDIGGGSMHISQLFSRPVLSLNPYSTPDPSIFLCSASTPPGGGVHGMCGLFAAQAALSGPLK